MKNYEEVVARILEIERAIKESGQKCENTRLSRYKKAFEILADPWKRARLTDFFTKEERIQLFATMGELYELGRIFEILGPKYPTLLFPKVRDLLSGPDVACDEAYEGGKSVYPRNTQFELFMMAEFAGSGFPLSDNTLTDVRSVHDGIPVLVECKRPQRDSSVHANLKAAIKQLKEQPRNQVPGSLKLVALSFSKILSAEVGIVGAPTGAQAGGFVRGWLEKTLDPHIPYMQKNGGPNLGGILAYSSMSVIQGDSGNPATVMMQVCFGNPAADRAIQKSAGSWFEAFRAGERPEVELI